MAHVGYSNIIASRMNEKGLCRKNGAALRWLKLVVLQHLENVK